MNKQTHIQQLKAQISQLEKPSVDGRNEEQSGPQELSEVVKMKQEVSRKDKLIAQLRVKTTELNAQCDRLKDAHAQLKNAKQECQRIQQQHSAMIQRNKDLNLQVNDLKNKCQDLANTCQTILKEASQRSDPMAQTNAFRSMVSIENLVQKNTNPLIEERARQLAQSFFNLDDLELMGASQNEADRSLRNGSMGKWKQ